MTDTDRIEYVIGAGCAGGFTQAPQQAEWIAKELSRSHPESIAAV
jgi:hypothetical protein